MTKISTDLEEYNIETEELVFFMLDKLNIKPDSVEVCELDKEEYHGAAEGATGYCYELIKNEFFIHVKTIGRNFTEIMNTIAHEMIHVKQFIKEDLGIALECGKDIPYKERWWEIEAHTQSLDYVLEYGKNILGIEYTEDQIEAITNWKNNIRKSFNV